MVKSIYSFDDCSILHLCEVQIDEAFRIFIGKDKISHKNCKKLKELIQKLESNDIPIHKFEPSSVEKNIVKVADDLLSYFGNVRMLGSVFKTQVIEQLENFIEDIKTKFLIIYKNDDIQEIKEIFIKNKVELTKGEDIPKDDDLKIISGYCHFEKEGNKFLISEDEHFWGYKTLVLDRFNIQVIEEWNCHKINP
jgi:hypothetical protein